ncbi:hypothetical protein AAX17_04375 [Haemophilus haemolyticus]|nr:hypothetical protein AAX17_04375 [Haemophilus haemolyticus]
MFALKSNKTTYLIVKIFNIEKNEINNYEDSAAYFLINYSIRYATNFIKEDFENYKGKTHQIR